MSRRRIDPALLVFAGGVAAALHVGKLPTAIPVLREALGLSLVQAGFLLSLVQFAGMLLGIAVGVFAQAIGLRRTMVCGLVLLAAASAGGAAVHSAAMLMALRAIEGFGFLLASMPAPSLIRRIVPPQRMSAALGLWGAYMPLGTAIALLAGAPVMAAIGWRGWWVLLAAIAAAMAAWLALAIPADVRSGHTAQASGRLTPLVTTLRSPGPWLVACCFGAYSAQWLSVIGFLPSVYMQAGFAAASAGAATALAALVNMVGNIAAGRLLQRHVAAPRLLATGFVAMALGACIAFADFGPSPAAGWLRYAGVLLFSCVGGLVPGTLFSLAVRLAPAESAVAPTVGWMQQWSALGQFAGPPVVAWVASRAGGWQWSGYVTATFAALGLLLASAMARVLRAGR